MSTYFWPYSLSIIVWIFFKQRQQMHMVCIMMKKTSKSKKVSLSFSPSVLSVIYLELSADSSDQSPLTSLQMTRTPSRNLQLTVGLQTLPRQRVMLAERKLKRNSLLPQSLCLAHLSQSLPGNFAPQTPT